jgi:hypothetical protein
VNQRLTAALFVALVTVAITVLLLSRAREQESPAAPDTAPARVLPAVEQANVIRVEAVNLQSGSGRVWELQEDTGWFQTVPTRTEVLGASLDSAVSRLLMATSPALLSPDLNPLSAYGLHQPRFSITLVADQNGRHIRHSLAVGNATPTGDSYYLSKGTDDRILVVLKPAVDGLLVLIDDPPRATSPSP